MKLKSFLALGLFLFNATALIQAQTEKPIVDDKLIFEEKNGVVAVEAELFYKQTLTEIRQWYITSSGKLPTVTPNPDPDHIAGASGNAYVEILPDTRVTPKDKLIKFEDPGSTGETAKLVNFTDVPGKLAVLHYKVKINQPGRYYVWVRCYSSGAEDNGLHVGFDNSWPEHGQRMQWCDGKNAWTWASKQRTEKEHCGVPKEIYLDIDKAGVQDIQFSMREDGFEMDKFILTNNIDFIPKGEGPAMKITSGKLPAPFPKVETTLKKESSATPQTKLTYFEQLTQTVKGNLALKATQFPVEGTKFYVDKNWLAINPDQNKEATTTTTFPFESGSYDLIFVGVGENDGQSVFQVLVNGQEIGNFSTPVSKSSFEEGAQYNDFWEDVSLKKGDKITVVAKTGSKDGVENSRGRWAGLIFAPLAKGKDVIEKAKSYSTSQNVGSAVVVNGVAQAETEGNAKQPVAVSKDGKGEVAISGELKQWHKVTLTLDGPFASETDKLPNPFTDYRMTVKFTHESGSPEYAVPAYFATDGNAAETSASEGNKWRAHLSPDKTGKWNYKISFLKGAMVATADMPWMKTLAPYNGIEGSFTVAETDKTGRDFRAKGRLEYVGKNHLQFKGSGEYFFKAGADAPETLLAFEDFDNTVTSKPKVPVKKYTAHLLDYKEGDPTWKNGNGKGLIGAINYLAGKGVNAFSFLTYNAGGDGDNVWPFVSRNEKFNYDCSKLDQWQIVFDHGQNKGMYLHFKTQETENDDNVRGKENPTGIVAESLDGGDLGPERILYYRELIARFGYLLALNWNIGEENTQSTENHIAITQFFQQNDAFHHNVVLHTYPGEQDKRYTPLLGSKSYLTGVSIQTDWANVFKQTLKWVTESNKAGKPWIVANDEQGSAAKGVPADPGYKGFDASTVGYDIHDIRKQTLWANIMAGGAGVEYYFGYQLPENDLIMEDFRSRDRSWDYCRNAVNFLAEQKIPFQDMKNRDNLIGNTDQNKDKHCLAEDGEIYLIQLAYTKTTSLNLTGITGDFTVEWFNPVVGGKLQKGSVKSVKAGKMVALGNAPSKADQDWVVIIRKR